MLLNPFCNGETKKHTKVKSEILNFKSGHLDVYVLSRTYRSGKMFRTGELSEGWWQ